MKILNIIKRNLLGFIIGGIVFSSATAIALTIASKDVSYDNTQSGSSATTVKDAIDDLYDKVNDKSGSYYFVRHTTSNIKLEEGWKQVYVRHDYQLSDFVIVENGHTGKSQTYSLRWGDSGGVNASYPLMFYIDFDNNEIVITQRLSSLDVMAIVFM